MMNKQDCFLRLFFLHFGCLCVCFSKLAIGSIAKLSLRLLFLFVACVVLLCEVRSLRGRGKMCQWVNCGVVPITLSVHWSYPNRWLCHLSFSRHSPLVSPFGKGRWQRQNRSAACWWLPLPRPCCPAIHFAPCK